MSNHPDKKRKKQNPLILVSAFLLLVASACCCCWMTGGPAEFAEGFVEGFEASEGPEAWEELGEAIGVSYPTETPCPTPADTPHPTPAILTCEDIERVRDAMTDLQWEGYTQEVIGEWIYFAGEIIEVYDDGRVLIDDCEGFLNVCVLYEVPFDVAVTFDLGQSIEGVGTVREVGTFLGLYVWINVASIH